MLECFACGAIFWLRIKGDILTLNSAEIGGQQVFFCEECVESEEFQACYRRRRTPGAESPEDYQEKNRDVTS